MMMSLVDYGSGSEDDDDSNKPNLKFSSVIKVNPIPAVQPNTSLDTLRHVDPATQELKYNPKYEELYAPVLGPVCPDKSQQQVAVRNMLSGYVEEAHLSSFQFENQRRTFHSLGYAADPSTDAERKFVGSTKEAEENKGKTVFESNKTGLLDKRKREQNKNPEDIEGFLGPWARYVDEQREAKPSAEIAEELEELLAKRHKKNSKTEVQPVEEKSTLHIKDAYDYQERSFLYPPQDTGITLKEDHIPDKCFIPKKQIHTWQGHTKGIHAIRWFPKSAHLLISCSMDCKVKLWEVFGSRRCVRTYIGHRQAVRDVCFNTDGKKFLSAGYDRFVKLWDTETGACIKRFTSRKVPYCIKFNPDPSKQHMFVAGTSDRKILCWDTRSGEVVQEYDRHLGAVNSITFVDENRRFVSTSDDKSLRVWEWNIPVDMKYVADPGMHSIPCVTISPNQKWLACQSMDNKVVIFSAHRFKLHRKKTFSGHMVAGYACSLDFSPDMSYVVSGDADGKAFVWDWKSTKLFSKWKAHDNVCIATLWHPHETSKVATAGWDGLIKYWD